MFRPVSIKPFTLFCVLALVLLACPSCATGGAQATDAASTQPPAVLPSPTASVASGASPTGASAAAATAPSPAKPPAAATTTPDATAAPGGSASLTLSKATFVPYEEFGVQIVAPASLPAAAWVGVIPSSVPHGDEAVNDENDVAYQYLEGLATGVMTFTAPSEPGDYDLRLNDGGGAEIASVSFHVALPEGDVQPALELARTTFAPNEEFQVQVTAPDWYPANAWVGIIPSDVPHGDEAVNDENDVAYLYLDELATGVLTFTAPASPGSYDLRLNDAAGAETASVTFVVEVPAGDVEPSLELDKTSFAPGEEIRVRFTAPSWYPSDAWVGLIPSDVPHGDEEVNDENDVEYFYLEGQTAGEFVFTAPDTPGSYDLRLNDTNNNGKETASVTFQVE